MSYNVTAKLITGTQSNIEQKVSQYINSIPSSKTIRGISQSTLGSGRVVVLIVHDA
ncbi:MAG: hypothetical protein NZ941_03205 [Candidatus Caldarchaeum sp.]|nr:hypothetical protein [Candidatus Caldarchaeum sp.]